MGSKAGRTDAHRWWDRGQFTVKLSRERLAWLAEVAARMEPGATPQEVVDHALRAAAASEGEAPLEALARLDELEALIDQSRAQAALDIAGLHARFDSLMALIREAASDADL